MTAVRQGGVALAIVLWFVAGMSLLVAGIVATARVDTQMTQMQVARAKAAAAGDGAMHLAMRGNNGRASGGRYRVGPDNVQVQLQPVEQLLDVNRASREALEKLFTLAAGIPAAEAKTLADNVVKWRTEFRGGRAGGVFVTPESLLQVEGFSRTQLDAVRDFILAAEWADGVATVEEVTQMLRRRGQQRGQNDGAGGYRVDALYEYGGRTWLRRNWVSYDGTGWSNLPWRVMRVEPPRVHRG